MDIHTNIPPIDIRVETQNENFENSFNIKYQSGGYSIFILEYQSGGYSVFKLEYQSGGYFIFKCENLPE